MSWIPGRINLPRIPAADALDPGLLHYLEQLQRAIGDRDRELMEGTGGIHTQHYLTRCTADTTINSTTRVAITGATQTVTPRRQADALVWGTFRVYQSAGVALRGFRGELLLDGVLQAPAYVIAFAALSEVITAGQIWRIPNLKANISYVFSLHGRCDNAADTFIVGQDETSIAILTAGQLG